MPSWLSGAAVCAAPFNFQDPADFDSSIQHTGGLALTYSSFRPCKSHTPSKAHRCCLMCLWQNTGYRGACGNFEPGLTRESWIEFQLRKGHANICPANDLLNTLRRVTFDLSLCQAWTQHCSSICTAATPAEYNFTCLLHLQMLSCACSWFPFGARQEQREIASVESYIWYSFRFWTSEYFWTLLLSCD